MFDLTKLDVLHIELLTVASQEGMLPAKTLGPFPDQWAAVEDLLDEDLLTEITDAGGDVTGWQLTRAGQAVTNQL
jgi:hypothetical protein